MWKLRLALDFASGTGGASGNKIRKPMGPSTWASLLRRKAQSGRLLLLCRVPRQKRRPSLARGRTRASLDA
eukprot:2316764-Pyramimonas_sp.AAC.1